MVFGQHVHAQNIIIDSDLALHAEPLTVKMGSQGFGKIFKWKFGDYAVTDSKKSATKVTESSNLLGTKTDMKTSQKFSFTLCNQSSDCALVNAATNIEHKALQGFELFEGFTIGDDVLLSGIYNFTASITLQSDTSDIWYLILNTETGAEKADTVIAVLLGKESEIQIFPATSDKNGSDNRALPALGFEFYENGHAVAAAQYYGGGMWGSNKNIVWIRNDLDKTRKLTLAAAVTALLQQQYDIQLSAE